MMDTDVSNGSPDTPSSLWLVAYDIACPTRLRKIAALCENYGRRLQYSVFLCACSREEVTTLQARARTIMDRARDHLVVGTLCTTCRSSITQHGVAKALPGVADTLVI